MNDPSGIVIIDKPAGMTSHDVVNRMRRALGTRKVGHAGTLDPPATGVLLIGSGSVTRVLHFLQPLAKTYRAEVRFGTTTTTEDSTGEVLQRRPCSFDQADLEREVASFTGEIEQKPPMFSAVKVKGEPLYKAARRGDVVERSPRKVRVYELVVENFSADDMLAGLVARVSSGTYIRTLAADLGEHLGCGAHLASLRRLSVGSFGEKEAISLNDAEARGLECLLPAATALRDFPSITVDEDEEPSVRNGRALPDRAVRGAEIPVIASPRKGGVPPHIAGMTAGVPVAVVDRGGNLLAVYRKSKDALKPAAVLSSPESQS